jgi:Uncharacterized protein conserved in bacteria
MKKLIFAVFLVIGTSTFSIYGQTKNDDILKFLRISGTDKLANQMMDAMIPQLNQIVPGIPDRFWVRFKEKVNTDDLLYACVPVYSKYYTHDDIKQLIKFYESPIGKKMAEVTPLLTQETMTIGQKWGEKLGQDIVDELIKEGYLKD